MMYGAKATQIAKAAWDTWGEGKELEEGARRAIEEAVHTAEAKGLDMVAKDFGKAFPEALRHTAFVRLCVSLANNPLVA